MKAFRVRGLGAAACLLTLTGSARAAGSGTRPPALAGTFYPSSRAALQTVAHYLLRSAREAPRPAGRPLAVVLPHAGWAFSGLAAAAGVQSLPKDVARVVVLAPAHRGAFEGYTVERFGAYRTPLGETPVCAATDGLRRDAAAVDEDALTGEHSVEVLLPFLQSVLDEFCLLPVLLGNTSPEAERSLARSLATLDDGRTLFVASGDFVHYGKRYGFVPFGETLAEAGAKLRALDERAVELTAGRDPSALRAFFAETSHNACGRSAFLVLLELLRLRAPDATSTLVARYGSSDLPFSREEASVGYATLAFAAAGSGPAPAAISAPRAAALAVPPPLPLPGDEWRVAPDVGARLRRLARAALEADLLGGSALRRVLEELGDPVELRRRQAVFVSLYRREPAGTPSQARLRGCRGQAEAVLPLDLAVLQAALDAAFADERFPKVRADELPHLEVEVTLLSPLRPVASAESYRRGRDGLVLSKDGKGALFLPAVWQEAGWSTEEALRELCAKAGLPPDAWKESRLLSFEGEAFTETGAAPRP